MSFASPRGFRLCLELTLTAGGVLLELAPPSREAQVLPSVKDLLHLEAILERVEGYPGAADGPTLEGCPFAHRHQGVIWFRSIAALVLSGQRPQAWAPLAFLCYNPRWGPQCSEVCGAPLPRGGPRCCALRACCSPRHSHNLPLCARCEGLQGRHKRHGPSYGGGLLLRPLNPLRKHKLSPDLRGCTTRSREQRRDHRGLLISRTPASPLLLPVGASAAAVVLKGPHGAAPGCCC